MKFFICLLYLLSFCAATCTNRAQRRAWHTLTDPEKDAYINAELCLMHKPATLNIRGATTRFEEFQATHQLQAYAIHYVAAFLPFHRAYLAAHERALQTECAYPDAQPYWAEELDAGAFSSAAIFSPLHGFGGGNGHDGCIPDGPFANFTTGIGLGYENQVHCVQRGWNETWSALTGREYVDECMGKMEWVDAWKCMEDKPHAGGHLGIGGSMLDAIASPGDPLFFMHHAWIDKMWADWQKKDLPKRVSEISGNNSIDWANMGPFFPHPPASIPIPTSVDGDPGNETTLNHVLNMYGNGPNRTIGEVMDIWDGLLCYEYLEPDQERY